MPLNRERLKNLIIGLLSPGNTTAEAAPTENPALLQIMANRNQALNQQNPPATGTLLDLLYRQKKQKDDAMKSLGLD